MPHRIIDPEQFVKKGEDENGVLENTVNNINMSPLEPIAVIGMACAFAGGINSPESLWDVLKSSIDVGKEIPNERFDIDSFTAHLANIYPNVKNDLVRRAYLFDNDVLDQFDSAFFGITDGEAM
ncbi:unnamed protein product [Didymodactylos carnosus]|nr:unnamed protein product [Didymodactylos carnosus]